VAVTGVAQVVYHSESLIFGVHGAVAQRYKVPSAIAEPRATTLDYIGAAAAS
jgi:hypothetical protein